MTDSDIILRAQDLYAELHDKVQGLLDIWVDWAYPSPLIMVSHWKNMKAFTVDEDTNSLSGIYRDNLKVTITFMDDTFELTQAQAYEQESIKILTTEDIQLGIQRREEKKKFIKEFLYSDISSPEDIQKVIGRKLYDSTVNELDTELPFELQDITNEKLDDLYCMFKYKNMTIERHGVWMKFDIYDPEVYYDDYENAEAEEKVIDIIGYPTNKTSMNEAKPIAYVDKQTAEITYEDERAKTDKRAQALIQEVVERVRQQLTVKNENVILLTNPINHVINHDDREEY